MQPPEDEGATGTYLDADLPVEERVEDLLARMTVAEKVGQLAGTYVGRMEEDLGQDVDVVADRVREYGLGVVSPFGTGAAYYDRVAEVAGVANRLQRAAVEDTRLGVPLLLTVDAVHGHAYVREATVFPNNLGAAATWDPELLRECAAATARAVRATGAQFNYSPVCDVAREVRWGRVGETFGESPFLVAALSAAKVRGYGDPDEDWVLSTAKHFPAYGEPVRGEDAAPVEVSEYRLRSTFLPPFEAAVGAGVDSVMPCYNAVDGDPVHGSRRFLAGLLREELGFEGIVGSDWGGVAQLHEDHRTAVSPTDAARQAHDAGLDFASVGGVEHVERLLDLHGSGALPEERIDESVRRMLRAKVRLGLFEDPYVAPERTGEVVGAAEHERLARETARESLTLLKNDGLLPLTGDEDVLVTGPNADDIVNQFGGWSADEPDGTTGVTLREGLVDALGEDRVAHEPGATVNEPVDVEAAARAAADADVAVVALGENWYIHEFGPRDQAGTETGAFPTRSELRLPDAQRDLVRAVHGTGTPVVGVLVSGRPLVVDWMDEHVPAILMAYYPGSRGGAALADVLLGAEPGGRLPISVPRSPADLPVHHDHLRQPRPIGDAEHPDSYDPLYPFGHGLSYADVEYRDLSLSADAVDADGSVDVEVTLANVGDRPSEEVVQVFVRDEYSSRVVPERQLRGFERVEVAPGEERAVAVPIDAADLGVVRADGRRHTEAGAFDVLVGDASERLLVE